MAKNENNKRFFKDFKAEIKKVIWPTPKQLFNNTVAIISMVIIIGAIVFVLDLGFDAINKYGLTNLQKSVQSSETSENTESDSSTDTETSAIESVDAENSNEDVDAETNNAENNDDKDSNDENQ